MATLSKEQVEQKLQKLQQLSEEVNALTKELAEAGAINLSEEDLEKVDGGGMWRKFHCYEEEQQQAPKENGKFF